MTSSFQGYSPSTEFDAVEGVNMVDSVEEQQEKFMRSIRDRNRQMYEYEMQAAKQKDQRLQKLAGLSQGIAQMFAPEVEKRKKRQDAEGQAVYYNLNIEQQNQIKEENHIQDKAENTFEATNERLVETAKQNGSMSYVTANIVKGLGKNQQRGFYKAMLSDMARQYPMFVRQLRNYKYDVVENGETVQRSWHELGMNDLANKSVIDNKIRQIFLRDVTDPEIQKLAVEYLYSPMQKFEKQLAIEDADEYQTQIEANEKAERVDEMITTFETNNSDDFAEHIRKRGIVLDSQPAAKLEVVEELKNLLADGDIDVKDVAATMNETITLESGQVMTLYTYLGKAGNRLQKIVEDALINKNEKDEQWSKLQRDEYIRNARNLLYGEDRNEPPTEAEKKEIRDGYDLNWGPMPQELLGLITEEDKNDEDTTKLIDYLIKTNQRVPLAQLNKINDINTYQSYKGIIKNHNSEMPGGSLVTLRNDSIRSLVGEKLEEEIADPSTGSIQFINLYTNAQSTYRDVFREEVLKGDEFSAHAKAMNAVEKFIGTSYEVDKKGEIIIKDFEDRFKERKNGITTYNKKLIAASKYLNAQENLDFTRGTITGTAQDLYKIHTQREAGIDPEIPPIFFKLAELYKQYDAFDIINAQLKIRGLKPIETPEEEVTDKKILRLRKFKSTPRRLIRSENMSKNYNTKDGMLLAGI